MPSPEEVKGMQNILDKLNGAMTKTEKVKTYINESGNKVTQIESGNVSPDAQEMYNILHKLQSATAEEAKQLVVNEHTAEKSFGIGGLNVVLNKRSINGYKKTYYSITENGKTAVEDLALFESAMAIVKNKLDSEDVRRTERIIDLDAQYASYLEEAAAHKQRSKTITESLRYDVAMAKHGAAVDKMKQIKAQIKKLI